MSTETELAAWRHGSTQSERLAAALLRLEGYEDIEPRSPLGGGDGRADILCVRGRLRWVGAVYFPPTPKSFEEIAVKFEHDLEGPKRHARQGLVFITNQRLTLLQRHDLVARALKEKIECVIYDVERIRALLDSPEGYGARIAFLQIPMTIEEQLAYFARSETAIDRNTAELNRLARLVSGLLLRYHRGNEPADSEAPAQQRGTYSRIFRTTSTSSLVS